MTKYFKVENERIYELPANVVEVVRCKDCKYWQSDGGAMMVCEAHISLGKGENDYCSWGKRDE